LKIRLTLTQTIEDDPLGLLPGLPESPLRLSVPEGPDSAIPFGYNAH